MILGIEHYIKRLEPVPPDRLWIEWKYRPTSVKEVIGDANVAIADKIKKFLESDMLTIKKNVIILKGPTGCGKTVLLENIIKEQSLVCFEYSSENTSLKQKFIQDIERVILLNKNNSVILINNIDKSLSETTFSSLLKISRKHRSPIPIITTSSTGRIPKSYKKACVSIIEMEYPDMESLVSFTKMVMEREQIPYTEDGISFIINTCKRRPIKILQFIHMIIISHKKVADKNSLEQIKSFSNSDVFFNSASFINEIFNGEVRDMNRDDIYTDQSILDQPIVLDLVYSNLHFFKNEEDIENVINPIYTALTYCDEIETSMFKNQSWEVKEYYFIYILMHLLRSIDAASNKLTPKGRKKKARPKYRVKNNENNNLPNTIKNNMTRIQKDREDPNFDEMYFFFNRMKKKREASIKDGG